MKHNLNITLLLVALFLIAQFIGLFIIKPYTTEEKPLPYNIQRPEFEEKTAFIPIFIIIIMGTLLALLLAKFEATILWKVWFFISVVFCLSIAFSSFMNSIIALAVALVLAVFKIVKRNLVVHNITELFMYGGLAAIFVPIFGLLSIIILLVIISVYDYIAVRKTKHMVALAKFQTKIRIFAGILIPYGKNKEAILGGGDVGFPLIFTGVAMKTLGFKAFIIPVIVAAALLILLVKADKKRFYPAMPILTAGCLVGYGIAYLL